MPDIRANLVSSVQMDSPAGWCTIAHCKELPQRENVSFIEPQMWPPNSPDLNPVDHAVWGALQQPKIYYRPSAETGHCRRMKQIITVLR